MTWDEAWQETIRELVICYGEPDYKPGIQWLLIRVLAVTNLDMRGLTSRLGLYVDSAKRIKPLLKGQVSRAMAERLERSTGVPRRWWETLASYR